MLSGFVVVIFLIVLLLNLINGWLFMGCLLWLLVIVGVLFGLIGIVCLFW